jgi:hypothetical protein
MKVTYTNGGSPQSSFHLHTVLRKSPIKWSSHNIDEAITGEDDAELVKSVLTGENPAGTFVNFKATTAGNFKVSLEELENGVSSNSNSQLNVTPFHADGTEGALITGVDYVAGKSGIDASTEVQTQISYEHHEIHAGSHFFVVGYQDLTINQVLQFTWQMPNTTKWIHLSWSIDTESETLWEVYEGGTINNPLANSVTPLNNNRNSATTSGTTMRYEVHANVAAANTDVTVSAADLLLESGVSGAGKDAGVADRDRELVLKQNELYVLRATATAAGFINFNMQWYEHTDKN